MVIFVREVIRETGCNKIKIFKNSMKKKSQYQYYGGQTQHHSKINAHLSSVVPNTAGGKANIPFLILITYLLQHLFFCCLPRLLLSLAFLSVLFFAVIRCG